MPLIRPFATLIHYRFLLWNLVRRDWQAKYRGSLFGSLWSVVVPFFLVAIYTVFFAGILRVQVRPGGTSADFALFLMCGSIPWWSFSETLTRSVTTVTEQRNLVKRVLFPLELLPATVSVSGASAEVIGLSILIAAVVFLKGSFGPAILLVPILIVLRVIFTTGLAWFLASLGVFFRDLTQLLGILLTAWMFLTPIFYDVANVPVEFRWMILANPMSWLVSSYRSIILDNHGADPASVGLFAVTALVTALLGHYWFHRTSRVFADVV